VTSSASASAVAQIVSRVFARVALSRASVARIRESGAPVTEADSIVDRAQRVHDSLEGAGDPRRVQAAVGGPCPDCGERVEITVHADSSSFRCGSCGGTYSLSA
jgi:formamidopyrimidine-DNA glycosylase